MTALCTSDGIVKVVYDHRDIASLHQLQHTVTADVASSAGHQNLLCHGSLWEERPFSTEHCVKQPGVGTTARAPGREGAGRTWTLSRQHCLWALPVLGLASARMTSGKERAGQGVEHPADVVHTSWTERVYLTLVTYQEKPLVLPVVSNQDPGITHILQHKSLMLIRPSAQGQGDI